MLYLLIFLIIFAFFVGALKFKSIFNPISIIGVWWIGWLAVASAGFTGFYVPSQKTVLVVFIAFLSFSIGSVLAKSKMVVSPEKWDCSIKRKLRWYLFFLVAVSPVYFYLGVSVLQAIHSDGFISYMNQFRNIDGYTNFSIGGYEIENFIKYMLLPLSYVGLVAGIVLYLKDKRTLMLFLSSAMLAVYSLATFGRIHLYFLLVVILLAAIHEYKASARRPKEDKEKEKSLRNLLLYVVPVLVSVGLLSVLRRQGELDFVRIFTRYVLEYHTMGFVLFDIQLTDHGSWMNGSLYLGRLIVSGFLFYIELLMRVFGFGLESLYFLKVDESVLKTKPVLIGEYLSGQKAYGQAFYTVLSTLYIDFRWLGIIFFPFIYGYFLSRNYLTWLKYSNIDSFVFLLLLYYLGIFSIFKSPLEGVLGLPLLTIFYVVSRVTLVSRRT